jgi:hypothetical protein
MKIKILCLLGFHFWEDDDPQKYWFFKTDRWDYGKRCRKCWKFKKVKTKLLGDE